MRRLILLMAAMGAAMLLVSGGVAYALSVQCDGTGDQDPDPGECQGTEQNDVITGTALRDFILALGGRDVVNARGGDDFVDGGMGADDISGGVGGDALNGGMGPDDIQGGAGTTDGASAPRVSFTCGISDATTTGNQILRGDNGNDDLDGGRDNDELSGNAGTNDLSGNGGNDCFLLSGAANERASGGNGDDLFFADDSFFMVDSNADDIFCGAGDDTVLVDVDAEDRVAADCEDVIRRPVQVAGSTPVGEVTITTPEGTTTMTP